jgi:Fe-S-cluster-containing dehydrogenase component
MTKWNLIVDVDGCTNCQACVLACRDEYVGNEFPGYAAEMPKHGRSWIEIKTIERGNSVMVDVGYLPVMCQHCDDAPCIAAAKNNAVTKRTDGIVIIDPVKAKGQKQLVEACPYDAISWNEEEELPQHWMFDAHLLDDGWKEPRAAQVCATAAIRAVKVDDVEMRKMAATEQLEQLHPEFGTKPRVWYKNLHLFAKCFIGGSVESQQDGKLDCLADAAVALSKDGIEIATTTTDIYGDFKFDALDQDSGEYVVEIHAEKFTKKSIKTTLGKSVYLGEIRLSS